MDVPKLSTDQVRAVGTKLAVTHAVDVLAVDVLMRLSSVGVEAILLKGASIARHLPGPNGHPRVYHDIDLLIPPGADRRCEKVLRTAGYRRQTRSMHESSWVHPTLPVVEPHHRLWGLDVNRRRCWQELYAVSEVVPVRGTDVRVLAREGLAFHIALHAAQHRAETTQVAELQRALDAWPLEVWSAALRLAERLEAVDIFSAGLSLAPGGDQVREAIGAPPSGSVWIALRVGAGGTDGHRLVGLLDALNAPRLHERVAFTSRIIYRMLVPEPPLMRAAYPGRSLLRAYLLSRPRAVVMRIPSLLSGVREARKHVTDQERGT